MLRILVLDDSAFMRKVLRDQLEEAGFVVDDFLPNSEDDLAERIKADRPNLVLSDFQMPNVDGLCVARTVRRVDPTIPVMILTANRDMARESLLKTMGVRKILHKPVHATDLVDAVSAVMRIP